MSVDTVVLIHIIDFFGTCDTFFFDKYKVKKSSICSEYIYIYIYIYSNNISLYYGIYSFNTSLLNKSIHFFKN